MRFEEEVLNLLRERSRKDDEYINPNFLLAIENLLYEYYELEDDDVSEWIQSMWGR